jgi:2-polyprenyl-6-methoxyphenol hydroxylase-like FAD-dependent oxidoreductase
MYPKIISRFDLTKLLYESLPSESRAKVLTGKKVSGIEVEADGVRVTCKDGSSYSGAIIIGADGAHSMVRNRMRTLALEAESEEINQENPYLTTYRCMWMRFPIAISDEIYPGLSSETHSHGTCTQMFAGAAEAVAAIYDTLDKPTRDRLRFAQADEDAMIERLGSLPLTEGCGLTIEDVYKSKIQSGMVSLEEGVVEHWSWDGRIVLVGDAAHKFTPITGAGCNNGIADVVALANEMHNAFKGAALASGEEHATPGRTELASAFKAYQNGRLDFVKGQCEQAGQATATSTWSSGIGKIIDRYVLSHKIVQKQLWGTRVAEQHDFYFTSNEETATNAALAA